MTQQIINTGAANDGTGESLRNAFNAVNENFTQIWAYGPVDTQVVISGNRVSTNQTNLDIVLAGNGVGNVAVASTVVPTVDSVYDLGSPTRYFDTTYSRYFYGNGRFLTGINTGGGGGGNVTFSMGPPTDPQIGDIWIESDTGVQYLYFNDDTSNQWAEMEAYLSFSSANSGGGNVNLTDIQSNVLPSVSNTYQLGTASQQWKTLYISGSTISIANTALAVTSGVLSVGGSNVLTEGSPLTFTNLTISNSATIGNRATIGNIYSDHYYYANGVPFGQGGGNLGNSTVTAKENVLSTSVLNQNLVLAGNGVGTIQANSSIIPSIDAVYDLGSSTYRINSVNAQYFYGNGRGITGIVAEPVNTGNWGFEGNNFYNINGGLIDNGDLTHGQTAQISLPANGNTSPLSILNYYGNFSVTTANAPSYTKSWIFDYTGNITLPTNTANINYANGVSILNGASGSYGNLTTPGSGGDITMTGGDIVNANVVTANTFVGSGGNLTNVATTVTGGWLLNTGTNAANITVPLGGTYTIWINGNIPNGIAVWNATVTVTNNNVPVIGQQFAWNYSGNALVITSIPNQIIGTAGAISNASPSVGTTTNVFQFSIDNNSGDPQTVNWGYTKLG